MESFVFSGVSRDFASRDSVASQTCVRALNEADDVACTQLLVAIQINFAVMLKSAGSHPGLLPHSPADIGWLTCFCPFPLQLHEIFAFASVKHKAGFCFNVFALLLAARHFHLTKYACSCQVTRKNVDDYKVALEVRRAVLVHSTENLTFLLVGVN